MRILYLILLSLILSSGILNAQNLGIHPQSKEYDWPKDQNVLKKLDHWQDLKFGVLFHWGLYSVPGIIESWELCSESWINRPDSMSYCGFKKWYWGLKDQFDPEKFDPENWAEIAKDAGMKYMIFTTKHHDGFNMFDTKQSSFKITNGPFAKNPRADVAKYIFQAFREKGFMIGAYYSKPDWHSQYFWWDKYATPNRNVNYDTSKFPQRWAKFKSFVYNQIGELMHNYGDIDILWLDGGWVRPRETVNDEVRSWGAPIPDYDQSIDMPHIAKMARAAQPGLLMVDRTVHGPYENYQTPERTIPDKQLNYPWESGITLGNNWGYVPGDPYKSPAEVIDDLVQIVAKGGSLVLGVGPRPDGTIDPAAAKILKQIGAWLKVNGEAIYSTRITPVYQSENVFFTRSKDHSFVYGIACLKKDKPVPAVVNWKGNIPAKGSKMTLLSSGDHVQWKVKDGIVQVRIPASFRRTHTNYPALAFKFNPEK